jgi:catechol 2,3-dioxygenase-like lactoylglutathione lyase family enzyme
MFELGHPVVDIAVICSNFDESFRFYHELLGMEVALDVQIPGELAQKVGLAPSGFRQVRLRAGDTLIKLAEMPSPPPPRNREFAAGVRWLTFMVQDVAATVEQLKLRGVEFLSEPAAAPDAVGVICTQDPDGIIIEIVQPL